MTIGGGIGTRIELIKLILRIFYSRIIIRDYLFYPRCHRIRKRIELIKLRIRIIYSKYLSSVKIYWIR